MTTTKRLTIWNIKNRWLRAAVAWLVFAVGCVAFVLGCLAVTVWAVVVGAFNEVRDSYRAFIAAVRETAGDGVGAAAWAALTGKDEPA